MPNAKGVSRVPHRARRVPEWTSVSIPVSLGRPTAPESIFSRVAIVGLGLIGGSLALAIRRTWPESLVIGVDRKDILERAMVMHAVDVGAEDLGMVADADLIVLAAPVSINETILHGELADHVAGDTVVTDVGSVKRGMAKAAASLPDRLRFVGGHPLAGASRGGLEHARADLFASRPWILCPTVQGELHRVDQFVAGLGANVRTMDAGPHDRLVAFLSDLPQLAASALMSVVGDAVGEDELSLSGRGLRDTTRLAESPADIWKDIAASNADNLGPALDALIQVLQDLRADLGRGEMLERIFASAQRWKAALPNR